jgi:replicative DNA helicase
MMDAMIPPHEKEMEEYILGGIILEKTAFGKVSFLTPEDFYFNENRLIFLACQKMAQRKEQIDLITLNKKLQESNTIDSVGGIAYLAKLSNKLASTANIETYANYLKQYGIARESIKLAASYSARLYDKQADHIKIAIELSRKLSDYATLNHKNLKHISESYAEFVEDSDKPLKRVLTNINKIDQTLILANSTLNIWAARPAMGKSDALICVAKNIAQSGKNVLICSLEMSERELVKRNASNELGIDNADYKTYSADLKKSLQNNIDALSHLNIMVDDRGGQKPMDVIASIEQMISLEMRPDVVFIDYLQIMESDVKINNREQEISHISRSLKKIAKEYDLPIIALAQLSRKCEDRADKRPMLSDLRESGAIEQDADSVMFFYREYYYQEDQNDKKTFNEMEWIVRKNRHGGLGTCYVHYEPQFSRITDPNQIRINDNTDIKPNI